MDNSKISIGTAQFIDNYSLVEKGQLNFKIKFAKIRIRSVKEYMN